MAVDKVRPLGFESIARGGGDDLPLPTELDASEDYVAAKGIAFENLDEYRYEKFHRSLLEAYPDGSVGITYSSNNVTAIEYFITASQITANRIARADYTYSSNNPATEVLKIYESDGTTIARTITRTFTYSANNLQSYTEVTT